jgi:hypothetical protein
MTSEPTEIRWQRQGLFAALEVKVVFKLVAEEDNFCGIVVFYFYRQLTPSSRTLLEKLIVAQLVNKSLLFM